MATPAKPTNGPKQVKAQPKRAVGAGPGIAAKQGKGEKAATAARTHVTNPHGNPGHHPSTEPYHHEGSTHTSEHR